MVEYIVVAVLLFAMELCYFRIADRCNIIDKPNERSSHSTIVLRGGGIIFPISMLVWFVWQTFQGCPDGASLLTLDNAQTSSALCSLNRSLQEYLPFMVGLLMVAGISFVDDIHSLPDSLRMVVQIASILLMFWSVGLYSLESFGFSIDSQLWSYVLMGLIVIVALFFCVGATNIINFMDGINGITSGYALAMLLPLLIVDSLEFRVESAGFIEPSYLIVAIIGVLVFSIFNFRPKGKAKCFAGDVGSIGIAFIILFALGRLMLATGDVTYIVFFLLYGVDGSLTIFHRIMLHENLGQAHRKHAFQLMSNELKIGHVTVSLIYMILQLMVSLGFIYLCPNTIVAHWIYLFTVGLVFAVAYVLFMMKYYHLHEEYLASLKS